MKGYCQKFRTNYIQRLVKCYISSDFQRVRNGLEEGGGGKMALQGYFSPQQMCNYKIRSDVVLVGI